MRKPLTFQISLAFLLLVICIFSPFCLSQQCDPNCAQCGSSNTCTTCIDGYFSVSNYTCKQCPNYCTTCQHDLEWHPVCTACSQNAILIQKNVQFCAPCISPCLSCFMQPNNCTSCVSGYKLQTNLSSTCVTNTECNSILGCQQCEIYEGQTVCTACQGGLYLFGGGCQVCPYWCRRCDYFYQNNWEQVKTFWNQSRDAVYQIVKTNNISTGIWGNWTEQEWNNVTWTNQILPQYSQASIIKIRRWTFAYTLVKSAKQYTQSSSISQLLYYMLPLIQPVLQNPPQSHDYVMDSGSAYSQNSWQNLSDHLNAYPKTVKQWDSVQLYQLVATVGREGTDCSDCFLGWYLDAGSCWQCRQTCATCTGYDVCTQCFSGYYLVNSTCIKCPENCPTCKSQTWCLSCLSNLILYNNSCISQSCSNTNCLTCATPPITTTSNPNECVTCISGFSPYANSAGSCYQCPTNCTACDLKGVCQLCNTGYTTVVNGSCRACGANCQSCYQYGTQISCYQCQSGYTAAVYNSTVNASNVLFRCQKCGTSCDYCHPLNSTWCIKCASGSYMRNRTCINCPESCIQCEYLGDRLMCYGTDTLNTVLMRESLNGNYTNGTLEFKACKGKCMICSDIQVSMCQLCYSGYYPDENGQCRQCPSNCKACYNSTTCKECISLTLAPTCAPCSSSCLTCSSSISTCTSCAPFSVLTTSTCTSCPSGCLSCISNLKCLQCQPGFGLNGNQQCIRCVFENCALCGEDVTVCKSCDRGFQYVEKREIQNVNGSIVSVIVSKCQPCSLIGCDDCTNGVCSSCLTGYTFNSANSTCTLQCLYPCLYCYSNYTCTQCQAGFILNGSSCIPNVSCNPCQSCLAGSEVNPGNPNLCLLCPSNCQNCLNGVCLLCFDGYYLSSSSVCIKCPSRCLKCANSENCISCAPQSGYVIEKNDNYNFARCIACNPDYNCLTCEIHKNRCTSCKDGYIIRGKRCISNIVVTYMYRLNGTVNEFTGNYGFKLQQLRNQILKAIGKGEKRHIINYIKSGSAVVNGTVEAESLSDASSIKSQLSSLTLENMTLLSREVNILQNGQVVQETSENNDTRTGVIVGVVIGSIVLALIVIITLVWGIRNCRNKNQNEPVYVNQSSPVVYTTTGKSQVQLNEII